MTYQEFKNKWLGKGIDYDGHYKNQCMDVYRQYVKEVLQCPQSPSVAGAKDVWNTYLPEYFERIENTPTGVPQEGDIVIWGMNPYGHIAICDHASTSTLTCFEQNWTELDGSGVTEIRLHGNYNNILGWLHFKETMTDEQKRILDFIGERTEGDVRQAFGALADQPVKDGQIQTLQEKVLSLDNFAKELETRLSTLEGELQDKLNLIKDWQSEVETAKESLQTMEEQVELMTTDRNNYKKWYEAKLDEIKELNNMTPLHHILYGIKHLFIKK